MKRNLIDENLSICVYAERCHRSFHIGNLSIEISKFGVGEETG